MNITTCDPRFDPTRSVTINGYEYAPVDAPDHPTADDWQNRCERAEAECAELREAVARLREQLDQASQIIGQIELDHRYPPAPDSMERRIERARFWLHVYAALENPDG